MRAAINPDRLRFPWPCAALAVALAMAFALSACGAARTTSLAHGHDGAQVNCEDWNTEQFFTNATGAAVPRCLELGMDANPRRDHPWSPTPLHLAAQFGTAISIAALIGAGADIEATADYGESGGAFSSLVDFTPLHVAVVLGNPTNVLALLDAGASIADDVVSWAAARGTRGDLTALIEAGAQIETALHDAVYGTPANIRSLLDAGADIEARDEHGRSPLHVAAGVPEWNSAAPPVDNIKTLLEAGADIDARDAEGWTPLHLAAAWDGDRVKVDALLEAGADIEARGRNGWTPLHLAATLVYMDFGGADPEAIAALLGAGANVEARDDDGQTPADVAKAAGLAGVLSRLIEAERGHRPEQYSVWEGTWVSAESDPDENVYLMLHIEDVSERGFRYYFECRAVPYGPNVEWSDPEAASFSHPLGATNPSTRTMLSLRIDPADGDGNMIEVDPPPSHCGHTDALDATFIRID